MTHDIYFTKQNYHDQWIAKYLFLTLQASLTDDITHDIENLGAVSIRKTVLPGMAIPMLKIRRPNGRLIFNMEIAIRRLDGLYIETGPRYLGQG